MRYENDDVIWTALRNCKNGATVLEIAAIVQRTQASVGARMSKMYYYGFLDRSLVFGPRREYRYRVKVLQAAE